MSPRVTLVIVAVVALAVRVGWQLEMSADDGPVGVMAGHLLGDENAYDRLAREVAAGSFDRERAFYQEPLYGWLLGQAYSLAPPPPLVDAQSAVPHAPVHGVVILLQHALGVATALLVALLGLRVGARGTGASGGGGARASVSANGAHVALLAGLFAALSGPVVFHEAMLLKAGLALFAFTLALLLWHDALLRPGARRALVLGVVLGVGILLRGNTYLLLGLVALSLLLPGFGAAGRPRVRDTALVIVAALIPLLPVTLHNLSRGDWVLTTYQSGTNAAIGQPATDVVQRGVTYEPLRAGRGDALFEEADAIALAEAAEGRPLASSDISRYWWRETFRRIAARPGVALERAGMKLAHLFHGTEVGDVKDWPFFRRAVPWLATPLSDLTWLGPLALLGFLFLSWRDRALLVARSGTAIVGVTLVLFYVMGRYRLSAAPCLWLLAAAALVQLATLLRAPGRAATKTMALLLTAALIALGNLPAFSLLRDLHTGEPQSAPEQTAWLNYATIERFHATQASNPGTARAHRDRAVAAARRALELAPGYPNARQVLIRSLDMTSDALPRLAGGLQEAWRLLLVMEGHRTGQNVRNMIDADLPAVQRAALELAARPSQPGGDDYAATALAFACRRIAQDLKQPEDWPFALQLLDRSWALDSEEPETQVQRGWVLRRLARLDEAEAAYRTAIAGGVDTVELHNNLGNVLLDLDRPAEAIPAFERALQLQPGHPLILRNLERAQGGVQPR